MSDDRKITVIPQKPKYMYLVAIYCRISTSSQEQLNSLINQISYLTRLVASKPNWKLVDIYIDIKSGAQERSEFQRMIDDCQNGKIDLIITKSISRFGRNVATTLNALNTLRSCNVDVYFEQEEIHSKDEKNFFLISLLEGMAQEESKKRSENIRWGILRRIENGEAQLLRRKCYGYEYDNEGNLRIKKDEADNVKLIFDLYLSGVSILGIIKELETRSILSPTGKNKWCKRTIETILSNEKYTGNVVVCKTYNTDFPESKRKINNGEKPKYVAIGCNPPIIDEEIFNKVQEEKTKRSNIIKSENGTIRKSTHYSSKKHSSS